MISREQCTNPWLSFAASSYRLPKHMSIHNLLFSSPSLPSVLHQCSLTVAFFPLFFFSPQSFVSAHSSTLAMLFYTFLAAAALVPTLVVAQLSGTVGPLTSSATKAAKKTCSVLNYGGKADGTTDIGPAISAAFDACKTGGVVQIPTGNYAMATWVTLSGGNAWALQFDGIISRTGTAGGNMFMIEHSTDFELFSSTSKGAIQGNGYVFHAEGNTSGPRLLRLYEVTDFSVHDIALVDSPVFHLSLDTTTNGEVRCPSLSRNLH